MSIPDSRISLFFRLYNFTTKYVYYYSEIIKSACKKENNRTGYILIKNFNPEVVLSLSNKFRNFKFLITEYYDFSSDSLFDIEVQDEEDYKSIIRAFIHKKDTILRKLSYGKIVDRKDLYYEPDKYEPNIEISFYKNDSILNSFLDVNRSLPIIMLDLTSVNGNLSVREEIGYTVHSFNSDDKEEISTERKEELIGSKGNLKTRTNKI